MEHSEILATGLTAAFQFAAAFKSRVRSVEPENRMELWDAGAQWYLQRRLPEAGRPAGWSFEFEKFVATPYALWAYGARPRVVSPGEQAIGKPTKPDGLLRTPAGVFAVELDHGRSPADWKKKLAKASLNLHSDKLRGVIFAFSDESGGKLVTERTAEVERLVRTTGKELVEMLLPLHPPAEPAVNEVAVCLRETYLDTPQRREETAPRVERLIEQLFKYTRS